MPQVDGEKRIELDVLDEISEPWDFVNWNDGFRGLPVVARACTRVLEPLSNFSNFVPYVPVAQLLQECHGFVDVQVVSE